MLMRWCVAAALAVAAVGCTPEPTVVSFTATPTNILSGEEVTLRWQVTDAETVTIANAPPIAASATQVAVRPTATTTYVLTVSNSAGTAQSSPVTVTVAPPPDVTGAWTLLTPEQWSGSTLSATVPALGAAERLAVIVLNVGGADNGNVQLSISGTTDFPKREAAPMPKPREQVNARELGALRAHDRISQLNEEAVEALLTAGAPRAGKVQPAPLPALPATDSFCTRQGQTQNYTRRTATLRYESEHLGIYVDDADLADFAAREPGIWTSLEADWEGPSGIYARVTAAFGAESDVDANGKLTVFFSDVLGAPENGGVLLGYFYGGDTLFARDETADCSGNRSNGADMFFMNGIDNLEEAGFPPAEAIARVYPDTLAHEFQHLINVNAHCLLADCSQLEEPWLNEGLSMVAEDIAGFGWNLDRGEAELYLDRLSGPNNRGYDRRSVTVWEGDPIGNYQGVHALVRYWADRYGEEVLRELVAGNTRGAARTEAVLEIPFAQQLAEWTTTLMFSNEAFNPGPEFNFSGDSWTPFHQEVNYVNHVPLDPGPAVSATVRKDGWNAFVTGNGTGADAVLTLNSSLNIKPHVVVVRFGGNLPQCKGLLGAIAGACP